MKRLVVILDKEALGRLDHARGLTPRSTFMRGLVDGRVKMQDVLTANILMQDAADKVQADSAQAARKSGPK